MADTVEQLQQAYLNAINAGDDEGVTKARDAIESFITAEEAKVPATNTPPEAPPPVETGVPTEAVSQEQPSGSGEQTGEAQAEPAKSTDGAPAPNQTNSEWLDSLAPEVRKQVELLLDDNRKLHHRIKADDGRVAAYQGRYHELQKKAVQQEEMLRRLSATAQPQGNPAAKPKTAPARSLADDPELSRVAQTDEELAKLLWSQKLEQEQKFERLENLLNERLAPINKGFEQQQINSELHRLQQIVPNAVEIFNYRSPEGVNVWDDWVHRQSPGVKTLALSDNADDVARAMELYGRDIERLYYTQQPQAHATTQPAAGTQPVDAKVAGVQAERERKLQAQPVGSASVRPPQNAEPTMEEIMRNPELLRAAQEKILKEELRKRQAEI